MSHRLQCIHMCVLFGSNLGLSLYEKSSRGAWGARTVRATAVARRGAWGASTVRATAAAAMGPGGGEGNVIHDRLSNYT